MKLSIGLNSTFNGRTVAMAADGLPLDDYTKAGAQTIVALFSLWGVTQILICAVGVVVLVRYRSLLPLAFTVLLLEWTLRKLVLHFLPIPSAGPPAGYVGYLLLSLMLLGLVLSLGPYQRPRPAN